MILFLILAAVAVTDQKYGKIFHWQILAGILAGFLTEGPAFFGRMFLICAAFYVFFVLYMMGAGDVKLMGVIAGFLGIWEGLTAVFLGFLLAAAYTAGKLFLKMQVISKIRDFLKSALLAGRKRKSQSGLAGVWKSRSLFGPADVWNWKSSVGQSVSIAASDVVRSIICNINGSTNGKNRIHLGPWLFLGYVLYLTFCI